LVAEQAFVQVDFEVMLMYSQEDLFQSFQMFLVCVGVDQHVIDVYEDVVQSS
jgi:hypothetical protein